MTEYKKQAFGEWPSSPYRRATAGVCLLCLILMLNACAVSPTGRHQFKFFSKQTMIDKGNESFTKIQKTLPVDTRSSHRRFVTCVADALNRSTADRWQATVFKSPEISAFALPGGHLGVYSGVLPLTSNGAQMAALLAHDIGHVEAGHGNERLSDKYVAFGVGAVATAALLAATNPDHDEKPDHDKHRDRHDDRHHDHDHDHGRRHGRHDRHHDHHRHDDHWHHRRRGGRWEDDDDEPIDRHLGTADILLASLGVGAISAVVFPFSGGMEDEADVLGLRLMARSGFDPGQALAFWQKIKQRGSSTSKLVSEHPDIDRHIQAIQSEMPNALALYQAAPDRPQCRL